MHENIREFVYISVIQNRRASKDIFTHSLPYKNTELYAHSDKSLN